MIAAASFILAAVLILAAAASARGVLWADDRARRRVLQARAELRDAENRVRAVGLDPTPARVAAVLQKRRGRECVQMARAYARDVHGIGQ